MTQANSHLELFVILMAHSSFSATQSHSQRCHIFRIVCSIYCLSGLPYLDIKQYCNSMEKKEAASATCLTQPLSLTQHSARDPEKYQSFEEIRGREMGKAGAFSVRWGFSADSYTPSFFFSGWLWAAPGVTGSRSNGGRLTDAYFQPWMLHIKKIDGIDSGWAGDKLLGCESLQWVCRLSARLIYHVTLTTSPSY